MPVRDSQRDFEELGLLREIHAKGIGLQDTYDVLLAPRLNIFTGDNGLGKSFMLELAWWCLTDSWFGNRAFPRQGFKETASIDAELSNRAGNTESIKSSFDRETQSWSIRHTSGTAGADIVIYAGTDGKFAVWDRWRAILAEREYGQMPFWGRKPASRIVPVYFFDNKTLWEGLRDEKSGRVQCKGFHQDVVDWQTRPRESENAGYQYLHKVLSRLSVSGEEMRLGEITRLFVDDVREIPTIQFSYGSVPVVLCSSGVQRIVAFGYMLVWAWKEHLEAAKVIGIEPGNNLVLIIDEIELHLHPKWQREILPAILQVSNALSDRLKTQIIATTHSPLVLASSEPHFNQDEDSLFLFSENNGNVSLETLAPGKEGGVDSWLESEVFGLHRARSIESERAILEAEQFLENKSEKSLEEIEANLKKYLPGIDPFLARWLIYRQQEQR